MRKSLLVTGLALLLSLGCPQNNSIPVHPTQPIPFQRDWVFSESNGSQTVVEPEDLAKNYLGFVPRSVDIDNENRVLIYDGQRLLIQETPSMVNVLGYVHTKGNNTIIDAVIKKKDIKPIRSYLVDRGYTKPINFFDDFWKDAKEKAYEDSLSAQKFEEEFKLIQ